MLTTCVPIAKKKQKQKTKNNLNSYLRVIANKKNVLLLFFMLYLTYAVAHYLKHQQTRFSYHRPLNFFLRKKRHLHTLKQTRQRINMVEWPV